MDLCKRSITKNLFKRKIGENYNIGTGIRLKNIDIVNKIILLAKRKIFYLEKWKVYICKG